MLCRVLYLCAVLLLGAEQLALRAAMADNGLRPHLVTISTDDPRDSDLGCYRVTDFRAPRIDRLAMDIGETTNVDMKPR